MAGVVGIRYGLKKVKTNDYLEYLNLLRTNVLINLGRDTLVVDTDGNMDSALVT